LVEPKEGELTVPRLRKESPAAPHEDGKEKVYHPEVVSHAITGTGS
jgi:hypothetical protein